MKKSKVTSLALAGALALTAMLTGTLAWQAISQQALNEKMTTVNAGGRLHDDFNGTNKDIYVENYTDPLDNGSPIYARIRLDEYMEVGDDAGQKIGDSDRKATSKIQGAKIEDKTTWSTYIPDPLDPTQPKSDTDNVALREYWTWTLGMEEGEIKYYMPTFNKDSDSLEADINGTYAGKNGTPYDDYVVYGIDEAKDETKTKTDTAVYDADDDSTDQSALGLNDPAFVSTQTETHEVKQTQSGTVITMEQWMEEPYNSKPGNYWVYDTDGWAYWAKPIMPGEATGLLLSGIGTKKDPGTTNYYAINVVAQFASAWDWGAPGEGEEAGTGFYTDSLTPNAEILLKTIVEAVPTITVTNVGDVTTAYVGEQVKFEAKVMVGEEEDNNAKITWMVVDEDGNEFTDVPASGELLTESEEEAGGTEETEATVTTIDDTGLLTIAEDADGQTITVIAQSAGAVGRRTLYVTSPEYKPTSIEISGRNYATEGTETTIQLSAQGAYNKVTTGVDSKVTWSLDEGSNVSSIDSNTGLLSVSASEIAGTTLTITATSTSAPNVTGTYTVSIVSEATEKELTQVVEKVKKATLAENPVVNIDGRNWYVLVNTGEKALLWMADLETTWGGSGTEVFDDTDNVWRDSTARTWLNGSFLGNLQNLKIMVEETTITTREESSADTWITTTDSVFLLSQADLYGTSTCSMDADGTATSDPRDYTYGNTILVTDAMRIPSNDTVAMFSWLRSPRGGSITTVASVNSSTGDSHVSNFTNANHGVRPALWISLETPPLKPNSIEISGRNYAPEGTESTIQLSAQLAYNQVTTGVDQSVTWELLDGNGSSIDSNTGLLTVSASEKAGNVLKITATSTSEPSVIGTCTVSIVDESTATTLKQVVDEVKNAGTGADTKVKIDDREWYVVVKTEEKALLWMKDVEITWGDSDGNGPFGTDNVWETSNARKWLNENFLQNLQNLKILAEETTITTRKESGEDDWITTKDSVFLLSQADLYGTSTCSTDAYGVATSDPRDYTYGTKQLVTSTTMKIPTSETNVAYYSWLRSPRECDTCAVMVDGSNGDLRHSNNQTDFVGVRPALWVSLK